MILWKINGDMGGGGRGEGEGEKKNKMSQGVNPHLFEEEAQKKPKCHNRVKPYLFKITAVPLVHRRTFDSAPYV